MKIWQITTSIISLILTLTIIHNSSYAQTPQNPCYPLYQDPYFGNCERLSGIYPQPIVNGTLDVLVKTEPEVLTANATEDKILHIKIFDKSTDRPISYLSFILNVTKGDQRLMSDRFFNINGTTTIDFQNVGTPGKWEVLADQYFTQGWINYEGSIVVKAPIFHELGLYHISLTIDNPNDRASTSNKIMYNSYVKVDKNNFEVITSSPLKQFKSGIALKYIKCASDLQLVIKTKNHTPACIKPGDVSKLVERKWADKPNSLQEQLDFASACIGMNDACRNRFDAQNMTKENQTASSIPQCVSNIQNQYAIAGPRGDPLCPAVNFQASGKIVKYTGFYGVYGYSEYLNTPNFVLEPGHNGTLSYEIDIGSIHNWGNEPPTNNINITNDVEFMHDAGMNNHPGVTASVDSKSEIIQKNGSAFVTVTFAATKDAKLGIYWVDLPPSFCAGGKFIILTITNCEK